MRGKLVRIQIRPGLSMQLYEEEARRRGLLREERPEPALETVPVAEATPKARPVSQNKKRTAAPNKSEGDGPEQ